MPDDEVPQPGTPVPTAPARVVLPANVQADPPPERAFSESEVARISAREKDQGRTAGRNALLIELGLDPATASPAEIKDRLAAEDNARKAAMTEAERREKAAVEAEAKAVARERAADARDHQARLTTSLLAAGAGAGDTLTDARTLLGSVAMDADDKTLTEAVEALKNRHPAMFELPKAASRQPSGAPVGTPPRQTPPGDAYARGQERARALAPAQTP